MVAEALRVGYHPNANAQRLRSGRAGAVGVVIPAPSGRADDPFFMRLLTGLGMALARLDLDLIVTAAPPGPEEMKAYRRLVEGRRVEAFILSRTRRRDDRISYLLDQHVPFVAHGRTEERRAYATLDIDGEAAFGEATRRLIDFGHRRIALINAPEGLMFAHHRATGWSAALAAAGIAEGPRRAAPATEENGFRLARELLTLDEPPTALLCGTDRLAVGALHAIAMAGLRAGHDVSVIGYDDLPGSMCANPALTTMDQRLDEAAARLVEMLAALLAGAPAAGLREVWQARLVPRQSDGPCLRDVFANAPSSSAPSRVRANSSLDRGGLHAEDLTAEARHSFE